MLEGAEKNCGGGARSSRERGLVNELDAIEFVDAIDLRSSWGFIRHEAKVAREIVINDGVRESGFTGTRDTGKGDEAAKREVDGEVKEVVGRGFGDLEMGFRLAVAFRNGDRFCALEIGEGSARFRGAAGLSLVGDFSTAFARERTHVDEMVGLMHHRFIVLDHDEGVPLIAERLHDFGEAIDIAVMEPDSGLVQHE